MATVSLLPTVQTFLHQPHGMFLHGRSESVTSGKALPVVNPADGQTIAHVGQVSESEVDSVVESSRHGFKSWSLVTPAQRSAVLLKLADLLDSHCEELAQLETLQSGKLINFSRTAEIRQAAHFLRYYAGWATKITGETIALLAPTPN